MLKDELQFKTKMQRFFGIRKFKKLHPDAKVLSKGHGHTRCRGSYYWARVQYEA